jgi:hypothetical protein
MSSKGYEKGSSNVFKDLGLAAVDSDLAPFDAGPNSAHDQEIPVRRLLVSRKALFGF